MATLIIPDYDPENPWPYPGDLQPGEYAGNQIVELLREHAHDPDAILVLKGILAS